MRAAAVALVALLALGGCASVPESSPVQVLRQVGGGGEIAPPPAPVAGSDPLELVRDFVTASASSSDKHGAARRFLTPEAQNWNDSASLTVLEGQIDTIPAPAIPATNDAVTIRIRGTRIGRLTAAGAFEPEDGSIQTDVDLVRRDGQWRISRLPPGVLVELTTFRINYRPVRVWFVDPARRLAVPDFRYLAALPVQAQPARVLEMLLGGPSPALAGAAANQLPPDAQLRSNVTVGADNAVVVDLTGLGALDDGARQLLAAQVVLSLSEVNVPSVRLLADGEPLVADHPEWTRDDVTQLVGEVPVAADAPALVVSGGRVGQLSGTVPVKPLAGPVGTGGIDAQSAATTADGGQIAVVARGGPGAQLVIGRTVDGVVGQPVLAGPSMTRPSWSPSGDEVWTAVGGTQVTRVRVDADGRATVAPVDAGVLPSFGPITDLRLSRDGLRVLAVVGGGLYVAALVRGLDGMVAIKDVQKLRSTSLGSVTAADWRTTDSVVAITTNPGLLVTQVSVDGLVLQLLPTSNLTPQLTEIAAGGQDGPLLVTDQTGLWSFSGGVQDAWRQVAGGAPGAIPGYPG